MTHTAAAQHTATDELRVGSLHAEYSLAQADTTGDWVAIGTITNLRAAPAAPVWILVGTGATPQEAIETLHRRMVYERSIADAEPTYSDGNETDRETLQ